MQNLFVRVEALDVHFTHFVLRFFHVLLLEHTDHIDAMVRFEEGNRERRVVNLQTLDFFRCGIEEFGSPVTGGAQQIGAMNAAELASLDLSSLASTQLDEAFQTATKLDAIIGKYRK